MEAALSRFLRGELTCLLMDRAGLVFPPFPPRSSIALHRLVLLPLLLLLLLPPLPLRSFSLYRNFNARLTGLLSATGIGRSRAATD